MKKYEQSSGFGTRLRLVRRAHRLTQKKAADAIGIGISQYSKVEVGINRLGAAAVRLFCDKFAVDERWLCTGDGDPPPFLLDQFPKTKQALSVMESKTRYSILPEWRRKLNEILDREADQLEYALKTLHIPLADMLSSIGKRIEREGGK